MTQQWYSAEQFGDIVGRSVHTIRRWRRAGRIKGVALIPRNGKKPPLDYRYPATELERFLTSLAEPDEDATD